MATISRRDFVKTGIITTAGSYLIGPRQVLGRGFNPPKSDPMTLLFFDDHYLNRWENLSRHIGRPELVPEATFRDPEHWTASGYPTVFRHESGIWRCLYQGKSLEMPLGNDTYQKRYPLVAESDDGIHWRIPDLTKLIPLPNRRYRHQLFPIDKFREWDCYYDERAEDPNERIKGLVTDYDGPNTHLWTSPDGLRWKEIAGVRWRPGTPDPPSTAFWNEVRGTYVISARPTPKTHPRRVAFSETRDWRNFSDHELVLAADALDTPLAQLYGMPVFPYAGKFVGLLWIYHTEPKSMRKYWEGTTDIQLTYSYNGWHFQRTLREPFMPNPGPGEPGAGVMRPHCLFVDDDDQIRIYSSSSSLEHGYHIDDFVGRQRIVGTAEGKDHGAILMHKLRLDGFVYLQSNAGPGMLGTRPLFWKGGEVRLNVLSGHEVRVQVTDPLGKVQEGYTFADCEPFMGDDLYWTPSWKGGRQLKEFTNKGIRLEVELNNARIYAIRGDFIPMSARETRDYMDTGKEPVYRPGF